MREEYKGISGVLYSPVDICNIPEKMGSEMYYFHNPLAKNPLAIALSSFAENIEQILSRESWNIEIGMSIVAYLTE